MAYDVYEVTIELENGDWPYMQVGADLYDYHRAVIVGLDFAYQRKGKLVSVQKIGVARDADDGPAGLTLAEFESWPVEKRAGLSDAVRVGFGSGKTLLDTVHFDGKEYCIGYVKPVIDRVEAE